MCHIWVLDCGKAMEKESKQLLSTPGLITMLENLTYGWVFFKYFILMTKFILIPLYRWENSFSKVKEKPNKQKTIKHLMNGSPGYKLSGFIIPALCAPTIVYRIIDWKMPPPPSLLKDRWRSCPSSKKSNIFW